MTPTDLKFPHELQSLMDVSRQALDAHTVEVVQWHFHESTGCPFWLQYAAETLKFNPLHEVKGFDDLKKFPPFEDAWLRVAVVLGQEHRRDLQQILWISSETADSQQALQTVGSDHASEGDEL